MIQEKVNSNQIIPQIDFKSLKNCKFERIIVNQFDEEYLHNISEQLQDKIVLIDLSQNQNKEIFPIIAHFISKNGQLWRGLELSLLFQNKIILPAYWNIISDSMKHLSNLESLVITTGGVYVSRSYGENHSSTYKNYNKISVGMHFKFENLKGLLNQFVRIVSTSQNLKRIWIDFQGLGYDCVQILPILTLINQNLEKCSELQEYIFSMNHARFLENNGNLTEFLASFVCLKDKKELRKFIMNLTDWTFSYQNFTQIAEMIGNYLTFNKTNFEEFEFDHSFSQSILPYEQNNDLSKLNEIQLYQRSLAHFLQVHQKTIKKFYFSLVSYQARDQEVFEISKLFKHLSECTYLERLSFRIQEWKCFNIPVEKKFYEEVKQLSKLKHLKFLHLTAFRGQLQNKIFMENQNFFKYLGQRSAQIERGNLSLMALKKSKISQQYRQDLITQMYKMCLYSDYDQVNKQFSLALCV